jgi:hypothetical protein
MNQLCILIKKLKLMRLHYFYFHTSAHNFLQKKTAPKAKTENLDVETSQSFFGERQVL